MVWEKERWEIPWHWGTTSLLRWWWQWGYYWWQWTQCKCRWTPNDDNSDMDDGEPANNDGKNYQAPGDPVGRPCGSRGPRGGCGPWRTPETYGISGPCLHGLVCLMCNLVCKGWWRFWKLPFAQQWLDEFTRHCRRCKIC